MPRFRNTHFNYVDAKSEKITSEEFEHEEQVKNGSLHLIGTKKTINLCNDEWAKNHFPNPKDYTLENLIKSGANLQETTELLDNSEEEINEFNDKLNKEENDN